MCTKLDIFDFIVFYEKKILCEDKREVSDRDSMYQLCLMQIQKYSYDENKFTKNQSVGENRTLEWVYVHVLNLYK